MVVFLTVFFLIVFFTSNVDSETTEEPNAKEYTHEKAKKSIMQIIYINKCSQDRTHIDDFINCTIKSL